MNSKFSAHNEAKPRRAAQRGFTLVELALATVVLLVGVIAVTQLVPAAMQSNLGNRYDSTAMVLAQRELDQMLDQPITATQFTDADGRVIQLGNPATPNVQVGCPAQMVGPVARINFTAPAVANYNFVYTDPNDPTQPTYQFRWAVITTVQGTTPASKRFIVGVWMINAPLATTSVTLDDWVQR